MSDTAEDMDLRCFTIRSSPGRTLIEGPRSELRRLAELLLKVSDNPAVDWLTAEDNDFQSRLVVRVIGSTKE